MWNPVDADASRTRAPREISPACLRRALVALALAAPGLTAGAQTQVAAPSHWSVPYNVVWTTQSRDVSESMPCGGGDVGLNVWVQNGSLLIYLSRSGTFDELSGMPKLGRLRMTLSPNPFAGGGTFRQELKLREGHVEVLGERAGLQAQIEVWVDVFRPVVHVDVQTSSPTRVTASYESWRLADRTLSDPELDVCRSWRGAPAKAVARADQVGFWGGGVRFVHRNEGFTCFDLLVQQQGLEGIRDRLWNPLQDLAFGGLFWGEDMVPVGTRDGQYASTPFRAWWLESRAPGTRHELSAVLHVAHAKTIDEWDAGLQAIRRDAEANRAAARRNTQEWWRGFWERSYILVHPDRPDPASGPWQVGRNYQVFRYQLGCNARGAYPTKFNGGLFTFDPEYVDPRRTYSPDFRRWGGGSLTAQNQRLLAWPLLKSGDFDLMKPQLDFYLRALGNAEARARVYWGVQGACFAEQIEHFGLPVGYEYGWNRGPAIEPGVEDNAWVNYQWDTVFEFCKMILDLRTYSGRDIREYLPLIESCLTFYNEFYPLQEQKRSGRPFSEDGKLVLFPGTALETYKDALNPSSTLAALRGVLTSVIALPDAYLDAARRRHWQVMLDRLPGIDLREMNGRTVIAPAWTWSRIQNVELPQLYPVYPWGLYGVGLPDLDLAIRTWRYGIDHPEPDRQKDYVSWHQPAIFCARLGLTDEAADYTLKKMRDSGRRFPTWWGPGRDWVPDHNWGGSGMIGLQEMLLQTVGEKILLLPAWPKAWDVRFRLHAPYNTVVEGMVADGKLVSAKITPSGRTRDVVLPEEWK